ncbi:MAG: 16S rRNA (cytosine(967)-C(5))-methyltransferase RsmB [Pyrinomonadaceae bacterium]
MKISPARAAAFDVLIKVETERAFSSILLPAAEARLGKADRGLCHELVLGVLRNQILLDRLIDLHTSQKKLDPAVRVALRVGVYQLTRLDRVPAYSAISESVELVRRARKTSAAGLVNAVLRRISQGTTQLEFADEIEEVSVTNSHPRWLVERWIAQSGINETRRLVEVDNRPAPLAFRLTARGVAAGIKTSAWNASSVTSGAFVAERATGELMSLADQGVIYFQDEASQMVAREIGLARGTRFLDVCAAPGSKTSLIAMESAKSRPTIVAGDLYDGRVRTMRANCLRQGVEGISFLRYDAGRTLPFAGASFDSVLVDAPCSGTGTIRQNPEIRYFLSSGEFAEFQTKQLAILRSASDVVRPGGRLVYSTCSLEREENEDVCAAFLSEAPDFELARPRADERFVTADGFVRTWPQRDDTEGFFAAVFERR